MRVGELALQWRSKRGHRPIIIIDRPTMPIERHLLFGFNYLSNWRLRMDG